MITTGGLMNRQMHTVATLADGTKLYADLIKLPLSANISRNPHLLNLLEEAAKDIELTLPMIEMECDLKRIVGYTEVISTKSTDTVFYARQTKNSGFTRFVKNRPTDETRRISMQLVRDEDGDYEVQNVWVGRMVPAKPGEPGETVESKAFWETHAVIHNGQSFISSTLTKTSPY